MEKVSHCIREENRKVSRKKDKEGNLIVNVVFRIGGVTAMDDFLVKFFPTVYGKKLHARENNYCKYDNQFLQLFTSSLYLAALFSTFVASKICSKFGRKRTILIASIFFLVGAALSAAAQQLWMLILARILLGVGVGFGNEVYLLLLKISVSACIGLCFHYIFLSSISFY